MADAVAYGKDAVNNGVAQAMTPVAQQLFAANAPAVGPTIAQERKPEADIHMNRMVYEEQGKPHRTQRFKRGSNGNKKMQRQK
jgi:hypothetical protein